jgi:hypothetical protein
LDLSSNYLTLPITPLAGMTSLTVADLSNNQLQCPSDGRLDSLLTSFSVSPQSLRLDNNPLTNCIWDSAVTSLVNSPLLQTLTVSHTGVTQLPADLFAPNLPWRMLDFSYCQLTVGLSDRYAPPSQLIRLSLLGNSNLTAPVSGLPSWLQLDPSVAQQNVGELFTCPITYISSNPVATLQLPSQYTDYSQCSCQSGTFGTPPACQMQISELELQSSDSQLSDSQLLPSLDASASTQLMSLMAPAVLASGAFVRMRSLLSAVDSNMSFVGSVVTDSWFGSSRATPGVNSDFIVTAPSTARVLRLVVLVNREEFTRRSDVLTVHAGRTDQEVSSTYVLQGDSVDLPVVNLCTPNMSAAALNDLAAARALELLSSAGSAAPLQQATYLSDVRSSLAEFCSASVWVVDVYSTSATLNFRSNSVSGAFFVATWVSSPLCPDGLEPSLSSSGCVSRYKMAPGVQQAAVVAAAVMGFALVCIAAIFLWHRDSIVVRTTSLPLQLSLLVCLLALCVGAALYTVTPTSPTDDRVCFGRAWLTLLPIAMILSALFARASYVISIFESHGLRIEDSRQSARWVVIAMLAELALLIPFTAMPLSGAALREQSSLPDQLILECGGRDGFWPWIGVQIGFLVLVLIPSAVVTFRARKLPTLFNESASLFRGLLVLALCAVTVLPAVFGVVGTAVPEAAQAVSAFGLLMLVAQWTVTLTGPRLLILLKEIQLINQKQKYSPPRPLSAPAPLKGGEKNIGEQLASRLPSAPVHEIEMVSGPDHSAAPTKSTHSAAGQPPAQSYNVMQSHTNMITGPLPGVLSSITGVTVEGVCPADSSANLSDLPFSVPKNSPHTGGTGDAATAGSAGPFHLTRIDEGSSRENQTSSSGGSTGRSDSSHSGSGAAHIFDPRPAVSTQQLFSLFALDRTAADQSDPLHVVFACLTHSLLQCADEYCSSVGLVQSVPHVTPTAAHSSGGSINAGELDGSDESDESNCTFHEDVHVTSPADAPGPYGINPRAAMSAPTPMNSLTITPDGQTKIIQSALKYLRGVDVAVLAALRGDDSAESVASPSGTNSLVSPSIHLHIPASPSDADGQHYIFPSAASPASVDQWSPSRSVLLMSSGVMSVLLSRGWQPAHAATVGGGFASLEQKLTAPYITDAAQVNILNQFIHQLQQSLSVCRCSCAVCSRPPFDFNSSHTSLSNR